MRKKRAIKMTLVDADESVSNPSEPSPDVLETIVYAQEGFIRIIREGMKGAAVYVILDTVRKIAIIKASQ